MSIKDHLREWLLQKILTEKERHILNIDQGIVWTDQGPIIILCDGRIMFIKLQTPEPVDYKLRRYSDGPETYEYGSYKVTSDHWSVDLILTEDLPETDFRLRGVINHE